MSKTVTRRDATDRLGISAKQLSRHIADGMPVEGSGKAARFPWPEIRIWRDKWLVESGKRAAAPTTLDDARQRYESARAQMAELELAERRGELLRVSAYQAAREAADQRVAARLKALANRLAPAVVGTTSVADGLQRVQPLIAEAMAELYQGDDIPDATDPAEAA